MALSPSSAKKIGMTRRRLSPLTRSLLGAVTMVTVAACSSNPDATEGAGDVAQNLGPSPACSRDAILARTSDPARQEILNRAYDWIDRGVTYDVNRTEDGYRRDC